MIWINKDCLLGLEVKPAVFYGTILTTMGCLILIFGKLSSTLIIQGFALIITLLGIILLILGVQILKILLVPVGYLILMFSIIEELLRNLSLYFQNTTAWIASKLLGAFGMPVLLNQTFIELPHISLEVAKVCSGINHLVALVALAVPLAFISRWSIFNKIIFILFAGAIGVFSNGLRVALIGVWTIYNKDMNSIHGPFELLYVSFIMLFGMSLVFGTWLFTKKRISNEATCRKTCRRAQVESLQDIQVKANKIERSHLFPALLLSLFFIVSAGSLIFFKARPIQPSLSLNSFPIIVEQWHGHDVNDDEWPFKSHNADIKLKRIYTDDKSEFKFGLYIAYYRRQYQENEIISDQINWLYNRAEEQTLKIGSEKITIKKGLPRGIADQTYKNDNRTFYFWYQINQKIYTGRYATKLATLMTNVIYRRTNGAMVVVTINDKWHLNNDANIQAIDFIQTIFPVIQEHLRSV